MQKQQDIQSCLEKMKNILYAFAIRNPYLHYYQGFNKIVAYLLNRGFTEEEAFWILVQLTETVLPLDYYTNFASLVIIKQVLDYLLKYKMPKLYKHFKSIDFEISLVGFQWFICLFAS